LCPYSAPAGARGILPSLKYLELLSLMTGEQFR
jgi:hypothetical protein